MGNDRELLELAAKAAGLDLEESIYPGWFMCNGRQWNPLVDDGDAMRLSVKLVIDTRQFLQYRGVVDCLVDSMGMGVVEQVGDDPYAATRRAIVRAAAEIGKKVGAPHEAG